MNIKFPTLLRMRTYGDPVLRAPVQPVDVIDDSVRLFAQRMVKKLYSANGCGLAAPQVGVKASIIVIDYDAKAVRKNSGDLTPGEEKLIPLFPVVLLNAKIVGQSVETCTREEGCLSIPKLFANVVRPARVTLSAQLLDGEEFVIECGNFLACVLQHEIDHLNGVVFTDRISASDAARFAATLQRFEAKNSLKSEKTVRK